MFSKLLLSLLLVGGFFLLVRTRMRRGPVRAAALPPPSGRLLAHLAFAVAGLMVAGSGLYGWAVWSEGRQVVGVRVVNSNTGEAVTYRARRANVADRSFETLEGRRVVLAGVERLELDAP